MMSTSSSPPTEGLFPVDYCAADLIPLLTAFRMLCHNQVVPEEVVREVVCADRLRVLGGGVLDVRDGFEY